jgi:hypothetical protein
MGAYDEGHWQTAVQEIKRGSGVLKRGSILATGSGADVGKLVPLTAGTEAQAYGVLLDPRIDTAVESSTGAVTGSIARAGSFKGEKLIGGVGTNVPALSDAFAQEWHLRGRADYCSRRGNLRNRRTSASGRCITLARLSVNMIARGKYWKAGEDIPDEELPPNL